MLKQLRVNLPEQQKVVIQDNRQKSDYTKDLEWRQALGLAKSLLDPDYGKPLPHNILRPYYDEDLERWYYPDPRRGTSHFVWYDEKLKRQEGKQANRQQLRIAERGIPHPYPDIIEELAGKKPVRKLRRA